MKRRWQEGPELQMLEARPQPGLGTASRCLQSGEKGYVLLCVSACCPSIRTAKQVERFRAAGSLHQEDPYERKRASSSFLLLSGTEFATAELLVVYGNRG